MSSYTPGWITVPDKGKRYRDAKGNYYREAPFMGLQTIVESLSPSGNPGEGGLGRKGSVFGKSGQERARQGAKGGRGSALQFDESGRAYTLRDNGTRVYAGDANSRYEDKDGSATTDVIDQASSAHVGNPGVAKKPNTGGGGGSETRVIPGSGGATQTGKNLGKVNLPELDMTGIADFAGPSFPTQPGTNKITDGYKNTGGANGYGLADDEVDSGKFTTIGGKKYAISQEAVQDQQDYGFKGPSMPASEGKVDSNDSFNGNMDENGLDDNDFGGPDPADYASSGEEMRRRAAFLDADTSMDGLKAVEAGMGIKYAGGNHYANIDGKGVKMDSDGEFSARNIKNAAPGKAQALKDGYVQALRDRASEATDTPSTEQNPVTEGGITKFKGNSPLGDTRYGEQIPGNPSPVEFDNNNSQEIPGIQQSIPNKNRMAGQFNLNQNFFGK